MAICIDICSIVSFSMLHLKRPQLKEILIEIKCNREYVTNRYIGCRTRNTLYCHASCDITRTKNTVLWHVVVIIGCRGGKPGCHCQWSTQATTGDPSPATLSLRLPITAAYLRVASASPSRPEAVKRCKDLSCNSDVWYYVELPANKSLRLWKSGTCKFNTEFSQTSQCSSNT